MVAKANHAAGFLVFSLLALASSAQAKDADLQPLSAQAHRVAEALDMLGAPLSADDRKTLEAAGKAEEPAKGIAEIQRVLDARCLAVVTINPESRVKAAAGAAAPDLVEAGWRTFLLKIVNEAGVTAPLNIKSPNAMSLHNSPPDDVRNRWLDIQPLASQPMQQRLSGLGVEYRVVSLYSRDAGKREAKLRFDVGQGTQDLGFRSEVDVLFTAAPTADLTLNVKDENGKPTTAAFVIRDAGNRVYPSQAKRPRPRLRVSSAGLPRRRRIREAASRQVQCSCHARSRVSAAEAIDPTGRHRQECCLV